MPWFFWLLIAPLVLSMFAALLSANIRLMEENEKLKKELYKSEQFDQVKYGFKSAISMSQQLDRIWNQPYGAPTMSQSDRDQRKREEEERQRKMKEQWDEDNRRRNDISDPSHPLNPLNPISPLNW